MHSEILVKRQNYIQQTSTHIGTSKDEFRALIAILVLAAALKDYHLTLVNFSIQSTLARCDFLLRCLLFDDKTFHLKR